MKRDTEAMYASMDPKKLFLIVALPGMISMFAMSVYSIFEGIFIGHRLGEGAFAAINIAMPLVMINFSLADLVGVGASVPISIALGQKDNKRANNVFSCSVLMIFITALLMGTVLFTAAEPLCRMMGAEGTLLDTSVHYLRTCALCSPLAAIFFAMDNYLRISGYVKTSMAINICCNLATLGLLAFFLIVLDMDVVGSALAVSISMCTCSLVALIPFVRGKALLHFAKPQFEFAMLREIAACGSPIFLNNISGRLSAILINVSLIAVGNQTWGEGGGTTAVAVYAILMYASDLCWPLLYGISDSLSPAIGYNWGAGQYDRVKRIVFCGYVGTAIVGAVSTSILFFFPGTIAAMFAKAEDTMLLAQATRAIRLFCFAYLFRWFGVVTQGFFSAIKKPALATLMSVGTAFVFPVMLLGLWWNWGLDGIWFNFVGVNFLTAVLGTGLLVYVLRLIKKKEREQAQAAQE